VNRSRLPLAGVERLAGHAGIGSVPAGQIVVAGTAVEPVVPVSRRRQGEVTSDLVVPGIAVQLVAAGLASIRSAPFPPWIWSPPSADVT
jgi:hypothetical protein